MHESVFDSTRFDGKRGNESKEVKREMTRCKLGERDRGSKHFAHRIASHHRNAIGSVVLTMKCPPFCDGICSYGLVLLSLSLSLYLIFSWFSFVSSPLSLSRSLSQLLLLALLFLPDSTYYLRKTCHRIRSIFNQEGSFRQKKNRLDEVFSLFIF